MASGVANADSVQASVSFTLSNGLENLQLTGSAAISGIGNELNNQLLGNSAANLLDGGEGNDYLNGGAGADTLIGGGGDDLYQVDDAADVVQENADSGYDTILTSASISLPEQVEQLRASGSAALTLSGNALNNAIVGNDGNNLISGGAGDDYLQGGAGNDIFLFARGDGQDTLVTTDALGAMNTLRFGTGIVETDVIGLKMGNDLVLKVKNGGAGATDRIALKDYYALDSTNGTNGSDQIQVEFANGEIWGKDMLQNVAERATYNHAPQMGSPVPTLYAHASNTFSYVIPANTFIDIDGGDVVTYSIKMQDGSALPDWLFFDASTRTLQAAPDMADRGEVSLRVYGTDDYGSSISTGLRFVVGEPDQAPVLASELLDQEAVINTNFSYSLPNQAFTDPDVGDTLSYSATLLDGSALPAWLRFDPQNRSFSGSPTALGALDVRVIASDQCGLTVADVFHISLLQEHRVLGTNGNDTLFGGSGDDLLVGGAGNDVLRGGLQNDTYVFGRNQGSDYIFEYDYYSRTGGVEKIKLEAGIVPSDVKLYRTSDITPGIANANNIDDLVLVLNESNQQIRVGDHFNTAEDCAIENIVFENGTVWTQADILAKLIDHSGTRTTQRGSSGDDVFMIDHPLDEIDEGDLGGLDKIFSSVSYNMQNYLGNAIADEMELTGVLNLSGIGNARQNTIKGNTGDNVLNGMAGDDVLIGGAGDDTYVVESAINFSSGNISRESVENDILRDSLIEARNAGTDILIAGTYHATLPANLDNMNVLGRGIRFSDGYIVRDIKGNELDNVLDLSSAEEGLTRVDGGAGNDTMLGGRADETYVVDQIGDVVIEQNYGANNSVSLHDMVEASIAYHLPANVEALVLTGNAAINGHGNAENNLLDGSRNAAANQLYGGRGDDAYLQGDGDGVHEEVAGGIDTVSIAGIRSGDFFLQDYVNIENISLQDDSSGNLHGDAGNNTVTGNRGNNLLSGGAGDDLLFDDAQLGFRGSYGQYVPSNDNDQLSGGSGNDKLVSYTGNDLLDGGAGNDELSGGTGDTSFVFGAGYGHDTILRDSGDRQAQYASNGDALLVKADINPLAIQIVRHGTTLQVSGGQDTSDTIDIIDFFTDATNWTSGNSIERLLFADGSYWDAPALIARAQGNNRANATKDTDILSGGSGNDVLDGLGGNDILRGDAGSDLLQGNTGDDLLFGGDGADSLVGGTGNDVLIGGVGADSYRFERGFGSDVLEEAGATSSSEMDSIEFGSGILPSDVMVVRGQNDFQQTLTLQLKGSQSLDQILLRASSQLEGGIVPYDGGLEQVKFADGTMWSALDLIERAKTIEGTDAADMLLGDASNNKLLSYAGNDSLHGGDGQDLIDGGLGADQMSGGEGDDLFIVDDAGDVVKESANQGNDTVHSSVTIAQLAVNVENLLLTGGSAINGKGNASNNMLTGNIADNLLDGAAGADTMLGGLGNDTYVIDNAGDVVTELLAEGTDTIQSVLTYTLGANLENLTLTGTNAINGIGNDSANSLIGNAASNLLDGGKGADKMAGGLGNDSYLVDDVADLVSEALNAGLDTITSSVTYTLPANVEKLILSGVTSINGFGNSDANTLIGNSTHNLLNGGGNADVMLGGLGNDIYIVDHASDTAKENVGEGTDIVNSSVSFTLTDNFENITLIGNAAINAAGNKLANVLRGNSAANVLRGGDGNDTYYVSSGDIVSELANEGNDTVFADISFTLTGTVENLILTGSANLNGTAGTGNNSITGNSGNNILDGGVGADTLAGGAGNDIYKVDDALDNVQESASAGIDLVQSTVSFTLRDNVEALQLLNSASLSGTGNAAANLLQGNAAANLLNGAAGNDILQGAAGADNLQDTIGNNLLYGGAGDDILNAGSGNDFLAGGLGNDNLTTGSGLDVIAFNRGDGMDVINLSSGIDNTLSLGKGIKYADLLFKKAGNDLVLATGVNEQINLKDWYLAANHHSIANLQIVIEGTSDYVPSSSNQLNNNKIEQFNFDGLVSKFDQARASNPAVTSWALSNSLLEFYLTGSDTAALGGDIAYQYAKSGNLSVFSMSPAQAVLSNPQFGSIQLLQSTAALQDTSLFLM